MSETKESTPRWAVGQSAPLELDHALAVAGGGYSPGALSPEHAALAQRLAPEWRAEWSRFLGAPRSAVGTLELAASLAGVLTAADYGAATLAIRTLSVEAALRRAAELAAPQGLVADPALPPGERLADLALRLLVVTHRSAGFHLAPGDEGERRLAEDVAPIPRILAGGDLHAPFWHWLDRFYYETYRPWRAARSDTAARLEQRAILALGAREKVGEAPDTSWLSPHNPLLRYPELAGAVRAGELGLLFWAEPFGLADSWALLPGFVAVSFAEPGALYERFQEVAADLATRVAALSDPTRLIILRLIRNFGMINTEMAEYLQLARPTVSVHARILRDAGLIRSHQEGRLVRHELAAGEVRRLFRELERFLDLPDGEKAC